MMIERTHDMELVASIIEHPAIRPHVGDDDAEFKAIDIDVLNWMLVRLDSGEASGVFLVHAQNSYCFEMHTCLLPSMHGPMASRAAQLLLQWAFEETQCAKMITRVPYYNRRALRFARANGMKQEGINRSSYMHRGVMIDQIMLGIKKEEWKSCQQQS